MSSVPEEHRAAVIAALKGDINNDKEATPPITAPASMHVATHEATSLPSSGSWSAQIADAFRFQNPPEI